MKLTIIIPIYNVERWLGRCIESCLKQDIPLSEYELILVDDGSKDNSPLIIQTYANKYNNIKVLTQENQGQSSARNNGLKCAQGDYVWFVDSDDWIEENSIGRLLDILINNNLDALSINMKLAFENGVHQSDIPRIDFVDKVFSGLDFLIKVKFPMAACSIIYKRKFLMDNGLRFIEGIIHEDMDFIPRSIALSKRITFTSQEVYFYFQREGSTMKSNQSKKRSHDLLVVADALYDFQKTIPDNKEVKGYFRKQIAFVFLQSLSYYRLNYFPVSEYQNKEYYPLKIEDSANKSMKLKIKIANLSICLYLILYNFLRH